MPLPRSVQEIRQANGGLENLTDFEIAQHEFGKFQRYYDNFDQFAQEVGLDAGSKWGNRASAAIDSYQANMLGVGEAITGSDTLRRMRESNELEARNARQLAASQGAISSYKDVNGVGDALDYVGGLAIDSAPYMAEAVVGGVLTGGSSLPATAAKFGLSRGATRAIGGAAFSYPSAVGDILSNQREQAGTTDLGSAAALAVPYAALNVVGLEGAAARGQLFRSGVDLLDNVQGVKGALARTGVTALKTGGSEAVSETGQEVTNQLGRMAVDPTATLTDPEAIERYKESFVGGFALGGVTSSAMGGWRRSEGYLPPGQTADDPGADLLGDTGPQAPVITVRPEAMPIQKFIDASMGIGDAVTPPKYQSAFEEAAKEPSGVFVQDPATGVERELDMQELLAMRAEQQSPAQSAAAQQSQASQVPPAVAKVFSPDEQGLIDRGVPPSKKKVELFQALQQSGIEMDGDHMTQFWTAMAENKLGNAKKFLAQAVIDERKAATQSPAPVATEAAQAATPAATSVATPVQQPVQAAAPVAQGAGASQPTQVAPSQATAAPAPAQPTVTIGRKGREKTVTREGLTEMVRGMPQVDKQRILATMGMELDTDPATGQQILIQTANPRTADEVAAMEAKRTGKTVTRAAINQTLTKWGLTEDKITAAVGAAPANTVSAEELGIANTEGEAPGFRVEDSVSRAASQGLVDDGTTQNAAQKAAVEQADKILEGSNSRAESEYNPEQDATLEKRRAAAQAAMERDLAKALSNPEVATWIEEYNDTRFDGAPEFSQLELGQKLEFLNEYNAQIKDTGNEWAPLEDLIRRLSKEFQGEADRKPQAGERAGGDRADTGADSRSEVARAQVTPAEEAWSALAKQYPMMPAWASLSERQQKQVTDLVRRDQFNLAAANTVAGGTTAVNDDVLGPDVPVNRDVLNSFGSGTAFEFDEVETYVGGIDTISADFAAAGVPNALRHVSEWKLSTDETDGAAHGEIGVENGRYTINLNVAKLSDPGYAAEVARHEVGHAVDMAPHGGIYSIQPEMAVRIANGQVFPLGGVSAQIIQLTKRFPQFKRFLDYPLNVKKYSELNTPERIQHELFAQVFAIYTTDKGRRFFEAEAPTVAAYFKEVLRDVNASKPVQIPTTAIAERRTVAFQARPGQRAGQSGAGAAVVSGRVGQGSLAARGEQAQARIPQLDQLPKTVGSLTQAFKTSSSWLAIRGMFTKDLLNRAAKFMPSAGKYLSEMERIQVERGRFERNVDAILEDFRKLPSHLQGTGAGSVNKLIMDMTTERKWAFAPSWVPNVQVDQEMADRFKAMPADARKVIVRVFEHGHKTLQETKAAALENIKSEFDGEIMLAKDKGDLETLAKLEKKKAKAMGDFRSLMDMNSGWPYAPLKRFGKYVVMGVSEAYRTAKEAGDIAEMRKLEKSADHYFVAFAETQAQAAKMQADIAGAYADSGYFEKLEQADTWMGGRDVMGAFSRLRNMVREQADNNVGERTSKAMENLLRQMYLTMLSETSARKAELKRRNIAGADGDMMRAFATQGRATAHFIAGLKSNGKVSDYLRDMQNEVRRGRLGDRTEPQALYNEIMRRHTMTLEYEPQGMIDKAMAGTSVWMLLSNPSYYLVNAIQPWVQTQPMLASKHGYGRSASMLLKAYRDIAPALKDFAIKDEDYRALPQDVRQAVEELANQGVIDISLESMLGDFRSTKDNMAQNALEKTVLTLRKGSQFVEATNRLSTAVAAYRLERQSGASHDNAVKYAAKVIYETHGDYSGFNSPRLMRKGFGRLATQFRKFQLIQLSMFARFINQALKGASPEERAVARWALTYNMTHLFALGGLMGLPGFAAVSWVVGAALGALGDDEPKDPEATLRRLIGDKDLADLLLKGVPKLAGVDISGRVGAGGMLSILPYTDVNFSREGYAEAAMGLMGPFFGGIMPRAMDGVDLIASGQYWQGMEKFMPTGLANAMVAMRYGMEGVTRRNGDVVMSADELTALDLAAKAVGLPSNTLTDRQFLSNAQYNADQFYRDKTTSLKRKYTEAVRSGDEAARREVLQDWKDTQEARKRLGYKVQPLSTLLKAPREQVKRERDTVGGVQVNDNNRGFVEALTR